MIMDDKDLKEQVVNEDKSFKLLHKFRNKDFMYDSFIVFLLVICIVIFGCMAWHIVDMFNTFFYMKSESIKDINSIEFLGLVGFGTTFTIAIGMFCYKLAMSNKNTRENNDDNSWHPLIEELIKTIIDFFKK